MSASMRYHNPAIQEHLAAQYVAGVMTPRVRARTQSLLVEIPGFATVVADWSDSLVSLQSQLPEVEPIADVWQAIDQVISPQPLTTKEPWWRNLLLWQITGVTGACASVFLAVALTLFITASPNQPSPSFAQSQTVPNYVAVMSQHDVGGQVADEIEFVINAYAKTDTSPSRLFLQWSQDSAGNKDKHTLHVWAEDKTTGELTYIGVPEKGQPMDLVKATWQAVSNSSRLLVTQNDQRPTVTNTLFSGPCIQLGEWQSQET